MDGKDFSERLSPLRAPPQGLSWPPEPALRGPAAPPHPDFSPVREREVPIAGYEVKALYPDPESLAQEEQRLRLLREIVIRLPEVYRQVLELRCGRNLSPDETAAQLHISRSNVNTRLNRAATLVRRRLEARLQRKHLALKAS